MNELRVPAVGYIRMSTDKQEDSPARQRGEIERMAAKGGYQILCWYEDHGLTGTESMNRPEFQRLLKDAAAGKFRAVLMYEQSRFSREDALDAMLHWRLFRDAGVKLVTCQRGEIRFDDLAGLITAIVGQHEARGESIRIAQPGTDADRTAAGACRWAISMYLNLARFRVIYSWMVCGIAIRSGTLRQRRAMPHTPLSTASPFHTPPRIAGFPVGRTVLRLRWRSS